MTIPRLNTPWISIDVIGPSLSPFSNGTGSSTLTSTGSTDETEIVPEELGLREEPARVIGTAKTHLIF